jgi:hypothetical protein
MRWYIGLLLVLSLIVPQSLMAAPSQSRDRYRPMRITEQTRNTTIRTDDATKKVELKVSITGGARPYTYTWYQGVVGDKSSPLTPSNSAKISPTLTHGTYTFWSEIKDGTGEVIRSRAITVAIVPQTVGPLTIRKQPRSQEVEQTGATTPIYLHLV